MYMSEYLKETEKGHEKFNFVDINLDSDNRVFIDPAILSIEDDKWSKEANEYVQSFFDCLFEALKNDENTSSLFEHAHEQNATKLGYGNGQNGKGKTANGLKDSLVKLKKLVKEIPTISKSEDIPVLVEGFAEDCMSDLITNILHEKLNEFTKEEMNKRGIKSNGMKTFWTWNKQTKDWNQVTKESWFYKDKELLMVPKKIVRKNYLFKAHQYLYLVIIERIRNEEGLEDLRKIDIFNNLKNDDEHWEYKEVINYTKNHPDALEEYHEKIPKSYKRKNGLMSNEDLDRVIYGE